MDTFLKQAARRIVADAATSHDLSRTLVVFNNHRSEVFMRRAFKNLSAESGEGWFVPQTMVIDDLVAELGGLTIVPNEFLLFDLYAIHMQLGGDQRKYATFEDFIAFGDIMLADFSDIDRYCVDARDLFQNLHAYKELLEWDVENPAMSPMQRDYLEFYRSLYEYYTLLHERLAAKGEAYGGMAYRHVAERIGSLIDEGRWRRVYFIGFNAISECERRIIGEYVRRGLGELVTDGDEYYFSDPEQEAGLFLRRHAEEFGARWHFGSHFGQGGKQISIVECPENVVQCKYAGQLLRDHADWLSDPESTAVVLADESLILPVLNALPEMGEESHVNVSMGFAYADSGVHALVMRLLSLYRQGDRRGYYHSDVVEVLADYHIGRLLDRRDMRQRATSYIDRGGCIRCTAADVAVMVGDDRLAFLFPVEVPSPRELPSLLRRVASLLAASPALERNLKEKQALGGLVEVLDYFDRMQQEHSGDGAGYLDYLDSITSFERVYSRIAQRHSISFLGQPLTGLQILGMLETRNLDFRRVILLSANEGVLPSARSQSSLIPHELKRAAHLPTYEEKDAVYAYNFYRLLQRASEVWLVYSSESEAMGKGEESRFIKQVRSELARRFPNITVTDRVVDMGMALHQGELEPKGEKSAEVMDKLRQLAAYGFSPSSLSVYMTCPLQYYYCYVCDVRETEELDEDLDASQLGTCVHNVLKHIYEPYKGRPVEAGGLKAALDGLNGLLDTEFGEFYRHGRNSEGRNRFLYSVAESQLRRVLQREIDHLAKGDVIEMIAMEETMQMPLTIEGAPFEVNLRGTVDRIDRMNGHLRVIDYKTGRLDDREISVLSSDLDMGKPMPSKWLQLMCYALLYSHSVANPEPLNVGIYPLRNLQSDVRLARWDGNPDVKPLHVDIFGQMLAERIGELLDPAVPFRAADKTEGCNFCPVRGFCPGAKR